MLEKPHFFSQGREFSLIESLFSKEKFTSKVLGDDGYILMQNKEKWAISSDISLEGTHYRLDWSSPQVALEKAILSNISDINAMGGICSHLFFNLCAQKSWSKAIYKALRQVLEKMESKFSLEVSGGDTVLSKETSFFSITAMGRVCGQPLYRSHVISGHGVYVTGVLGRSAAGLSLLNQEEGACKKNHSLSQLFQKECIETHQLPQVPVGIGPLLASFKGKVAAIDISDGLSSELWHLSKQSGCQINVNWSDLPMAQEFKDKVKPSQLKKWVLHGGEEYQLLFTGKFTTRQLHQLNQITRIYCIGQAVKGRGVYLTENNTKRVLKPRGWTH